MQEIYRFFLLVAVVVVIYIYIHAYTRIYIYKTFMYIILICQFKNILLLIFKYSQKQAMEIDIIDKKETKAKVSENNGKSQAGATGQSSSIKVEDDVLKNKPDEKSSINVLDGDYLENELKKKTAGASNNAPFGQDEKSAENNKEEIKDTKEEPKQSQHDKEDFDDLSSVIMDSLDWAVSRFSNYVAEHDNPKDFEVKDEKLIKLKRQLGRVLEKHSLKMSPEAMFAITAILVFKTPVEKGFKIRSTKKEAERKNAKKNESKPRKDKAEGGSQKASSDTGIEDAEVIEESESGAKK